MHGIDLEVHHEPAAAATLLWAQPCWVGKYKDDVHTAWKRQEFEAKAWRKVPGPAGGVHRELEDLQIKWPRWYSLMANEVKANCRHVCFSYAKKQVIKYADERCWSQWAEETNFE